jgi:hypothetical protein
LPFQWSCHKIGGPSSLRHRQRSRCALPEIPADAPSGPPAPPPRSAGPGPASLGLTHYEFLHEEDTDPRLPFLDSLLKTLGEEGTICVYSGYEETILGGLAEAFPKYRTRIKAVCRRLWDLLEIIREHYYHPAFGGSFSIKSVLPALCPELSYEGMAIADGTAASTAYGRLIANETPGTERAALRKALLECAFRPS